MDASPFDPLEFGRFALSHWRPVAISIATAMLASAAAGFFLPKRYTATASLVIDLPAASDPRVAGALSPVYLESLRTYEHFASSDTIFLEAIQHLGIRQKELDGSVESLKSSVLKVSKPANTRILEISATLKDPVKAQKLAQYLAEKTVELNRSLEARSTHDVVNGAEDALRSATERLRQVNRKHDDFLRTQQPDMIQAQIQDLSELRFDLDRDLQQSEAGLQEMKGRSDNDSAQEIAGLQARIATIERQDRALAGKIEDKSAAFAASRERRETLEADTESARKEADAARHRLDEVQASAPYQGERLNVLDPGIVPERPSFPNPWLNLAIAFLLSAAGSLGWIAVLYGCRRGSPARERVRGVYSIAE